MRTVQKLDSNEMKTANDIAGQIDIAMSFLNSASLAAHNLGLIDANDFMDDNNILLLTAWSKAYDARKYFEKL
jgi:hypothetical protein